MSILGGGDGSAGEVVKKRKKCWSWIESSGNGREEFKVYEDEFADI